MSTLTQPTTPFSFTGRRPTSPTSPTQVPAATFQTPTPAAVAARPRNTSTTPVRSVPAAHSGQSTRTTEIDGVQIHPRVVDITESRGTDLGLVALAVREPEATWKGKNGRSQVHLRGDLAAITADDTGEVIALASRDKALRERTEPRDGAIKRGHGGCGTTMPTTVPELIGRLRVRGFGIARDGAHYVVRHHRIPGQVSFAKTPSDHRSIPNAVSEVRAEFGIDIRETA